METQVNVFNKGINSDLSPLFVGSDMWLFPTVNARFYNTGKGFACINLPGNTKSEEHYPITTPEEFDSSHNYALTEECVHDGKVYEYIQTVPVLPIPAPPDAATWLYVKEYYPENYHSTSLGAEIVLKENYNLIGAYEIGGVVFLFSVTGQLENRLEIGCFPSPLSTDVGFERVYKPLFNIQGVNKECNFNNGVTFNWDTDHLLRVEGKVEYDGSVNLYICSGLDLLRVVNTAFDINTGATLEHRKYKRDSFESATRNVKTPNIVLTQNIITEDDIRILETGGTLKYGTYMFYFRYANELYDMTKWIYETVPITIAAGGYDDNIDTYIQGNLYDEDSGSTQSIEIDIPIDNAYQYVEVGYRYYASGKTLMEPEDGIITDQYPIVEGDSKVTIIIQSITSTNTSDWDGSENTKNIELIPQDIHAMNNILYQANLSNEIVDVNIIRDFFKRVKLKCHVQNEDIAMPQDKAIIDYDGNGENIIRRELSTQTIPIYYGLPWNPDPDDPHDIVCIERSLTDIIEDTPITAITGNIKVVLDDTPLSINDIYIYEDKVADSTIYSSGFKYVFDTDEYALWLEYELYSNADGDEFTLKYTGGSPATYVYSVAETYNKIYQPTSTNLDTGDQVTIIDDQLVEVILLGVTYTGYKVTKPVTDYWYAGYMVYDISDGSSFDMRMIIRYDEITIVHNEVKYIYGSNTIEIEQNDAYYSKKEHIMEDVGYFGGEIYAYSLLAIDKYGNKYGPFPCTGIDHYYANKITDLDYDAYEDDEEGIHFSKLKDDTASPYTITSGTRMFTKNQEGIYRFPCRANYVKNIDSTTKKLIKEETLSDDIDDYSDDAFNLTQRLTNGNSRKNVLNIFKISFDFEEAYNWLSQADPSTKVEDSNYISRLQSIRNNIVKIIFLRAERTGNADNLIAQGIIQKPNTIIPYPKFYEYETLDLSGNTSPMYTHNSFEKLISYNFENIYNNCCVTNTFWDNSSFATKLNLHGQLGNSAIKIYDDETQNEYDVIYPNAIKDMYNNYGIKMYGPKSFIYSGMYSFHKVDYKWDGWYRTDISKAYRNTMYAPPALGAVSFGCFTDNNDSQSMYLHNNMDWFWGEMGSVAKLSTYALGIGIKKMYPQQNIFYDLSLGYENVNRKQWYNFVDAAYTFGHMGQYLNMQYPLSIGGGAMKIPFFKGYMPCLQRTGRRASNVATTKYYTTRCMYHPYDLTRAFFSPDVVFGDYKVDITEANYIKPIRKTIYSGLDGIVGNDDVAVVEDISNSYFKPDCWRTFFARPGEMMFNMVPFQDNIFDGTVRDNETFIYDRDNLLEGMESTYNELDAFYSPKPLYDSGMHMNVNPPCLLHSVRKYFKIESPRECMPLGETALIGYPNGVRPNTFSIDVSGAGLQEIDGNRSKIDYYLNYANDFTGGVEVTANITMNDETKDIYTRDSKTTWETYNKTGSRTSCLFGVMDAHTSTFLGDKTGAFFASNRSFKIIPYIALELNISSAAYRPYDEYPSITEYTSSDYRYMRDYTNNYYDRYVKLSQFETDNTTDKIKAGSLIGTTGGDSLSTRDGYPGQYNRKDIYVDYNYEDLTIVNLYKTNPENIVDITTYYSYTTEMYYEIGECLIDDLILISNDNTPDRYLNIGRGDCFLDRTYIKHTTWMPSYLGSGTTAMNGGSWGRPVGHNWEVVGAAANYEGYRANFTSATSSYAHGTTIGLITENRYNIALRGEINDKTLNAYPISENMPNESSSTNYNSRTRRKNNFLVYAEAAAEGDYVYMESLYYNKGYNKTLGAIFYALENDRVSYLRNNYPNRIRWSYYASEGSYVDGWRQFDIANYHDFDAKYGEIIRIASIGNTLLSFMPNGILQHIMEGKDVTVTEEQILSIGGNRLLSNQTSLVSEIGLSHKHALIKGERGLYGIHTNRKSLWRIEGSYSQYGNLNLGLVSLDLTKGINQWLSDYLNDVKESLSIPIDVTDAYSKVPDTAFKHVGVSAAYDKQYKEVLFTVLSEDKSWTICFNELLDMYTSLYSFDPYMYFSIDNNLYSVRHSKNDISGARRIYRHNNYYSYKQHFYNTFYEHDFVISWLVNGVAGERNSGIFAKQFQALSIESQQEPFSTIRYETKDQEAENSFIDTEKWWSHPEYNSHHWQVPIQIDNISGIADEDLYYQDSSMTGDWLKVTLTYRASKRNKEINIQSILSTFYISNA